MKITKPNFLPVLAIVTVGSLAGIAETEAQTNNAQAMLSAAGFHVRAPKTAEQKQLYASLPDKKVERAKVKGKEYYVYKDRKAGVVYIGREREHQRYQQLCAQKRMKPEAEEDGAVTWRWQAIAAWW